MCNFVMKMIKIIVLTLEMFGKKSRMQYMYDIALH